MRKAIRFAALGACLVLLPAACGSSEGKRKTAEYGGGGEAGAENVTSAGTSGRGGSAGADARAGSGGESTDAGASNGGSGESSDAGASSAIGGSPAAAGAPGTDSGGEPAIVDCPAGSGECDGDPSTVCEQTLTSDLNNCGACDHVCSSSNGTPSCDGTCHIACNANFADCDDNPATGCEGSLASDVNNCGACDHACNNNNGTPFCDGSCHIACNANFGDCDQNLATGCEQDLKVLTNCGACKHVCSKLNGTPSCDGSCHIACNTDYGDCDGNPDTGCETSLLGNDKNCGACGNDCTSYGATCNGKFCNGAPLQQGLTIGNDNSGGRSWAFSTTYGAIESGFNGYTIQRMPLDGAAPLTIWTTVSKTSPMESMVLVGSDVYWAERGADSSHAYKSLVYKKNVTASAAVLPTPVFVPEFSATFMQLQGNSLYWASGGYQDEAYYVPGGGGFIYSRAFDALDGGTRIVTVDQGNWNDIKALGVTTDALYWVTDQNTGGTQFELRTAPLAGSPISVVPAVSAIANTSLAISNVNANNGGDPVNLLVVGQYVYFNREANDPFDGIYRFKTGLTRPEQISSATGVYSMLVDTNDVYFIAQNQSGIWRAPINNGAGGAAVQISAGNASRLLGFDAKFLYYAATSCCQSNLFRTLK